MIDATNKILYKEESFAIVGACMKVHRTLGAGFLEAVYEEALEREFQNLKIPFKRQVKLDLYYGNQKLTKQYRADFICYDEIIVEIKAVSLIPTAFYAQLQNYLKCTNIELGMLINFGTSSLTYKRMINLK
ncbi:MAG TPA: GxxExxY protein [Flavobacterium sp.]|jgi:GxxExxY protein|uniref:GxxExxY protein n=1 Tax=Flavobacterium sp. TaxID=239 RepID=UPI001B41ECAE|nr:GxxExxY protein [Flavobacterium sp.]MBP7183566.1 GxxExxY protein [Flavobacterium sp.]HRL72627.1 GxxExxY protein [Flavobacterium sp.]